MGEIRAIFFWLSGVFTPPLLSLVAQALRQTSRRPVNPLALPNYAVQVEWLATGKMDDLAFCQALGRSVGIKTGPAELRDRILDELIPNPGAVEITWKLPRHIQRWLVIDLPVMWFERVDEPLSLQTCFPPDLRIFLTNSYLERFNPGVFDHLASRAQFPLQECLLIDASARRAVQALRHGLPTEIFLDARRLERMLILRKLINRPLPEHKPETSL